MEVKNFTVFSAGSDEMDNFKQWMILVKYRLSGIKLSIRNTVVQ